ncbi:PqqD family protein [Arthrobacter sp. Leaf137]|uniref:PqqD family protein n=1 Tax=Arthrobacter sp. Leaf137 TaxID=1736271 RepID=UPI0006FCC05A|nr:PqqD family protein [Arthrobacter sp. Leaf137]KQQ90770.1 pyrroloquinoline quinone biosynthesis protein PqqD [Arthrobacter sp. Leaf137]
MVWKRGGLVAEARTGGQRVALLHLDESQPVVLEGPAAAIWELIDGKRSEQDIWAELEATFEDVLGEMQAQAELFLASLEARRLIEPANAA